MAIHTLKTWPSYFNAVLSGEKTFEIRNNDDRGFQKGDIIVLREYDPEKITPKRYSGREIEKKITYVTNFNQLDGFVVFGIR